MRRAPLWGAAAERTLWGEQGAPMRGSLGAGPHPVGRGLPERDEAGLLGGGGAGQRWDTQGD